MKKIEQIENENNSVDYDYITPIRGQRYNSLEEEYVFERRKYGFHANQSVASHMPLCSYDESIIDGVNRKDIQSFGCWLEENSVKKENIFIKALKDSHKEDSKNKAAGKIFWPNYTGSLGSDKNNSESQSHSLKIECIERLWETFSMKTVDTFEDDVLIYVAPTPKTNDEIELNKQIKMWCYFHSRPFVEEMSFIKHTDCSSSTFELLKLSIKKDESNFMSFKINYRNDCNPSLISPKLEYNVYFMSSKTKNLSSFKLVDFDNQELITLENEKSLSRKLKVYL